MVNTTIAKLEKKSLVILKRRWRDLFIKKQNQKGGDTMTQEFENNGSDAIRSALERINSRPSNKVPLISTYVGEWEQNWDQTGGDEWGETVP